MLHLFRPNPATEAQLARIRELARWPGMPDEARQWAEDQIDREPNVNEAYAIIGKLGKRVRALREGP